MDKLQILLVDDELDFLEIMGMRIKEWGYGLIKAKNGKEAVDALMSEKPDLIILDYMLPDMDGVAVLKRIRRLDDKIPVIMFTAYPSAKTMKGTQKLGISAFIPKLSAYSEAHTSLKAAISMIGKKLNKKT